jgi:hypothetical protein
MLPWPSTAFSPGKKTISKHQLVPSESGRVELAGQINSFHRSTNGAPTSSANGSGAGALLKLCPA